MSGTSSDSPTPPLTPFLPGGRVSGSGFGSAGSRGRGGGGGRDVYPGWYLGCPGNGQHQSVVICFRACSTVVVIMWKTPPSLPSLLATIVWLTVS